VIIAGIDLNYLNYYAVSLLNGLVYALLYSLRALNIETCTPGG